jgi:uncharacterized iron-regulated membrane protein
MTAHATTFRQGQEKAGRLYRMLWRWHFYAGLFCIPFVIILSLTGATYLFKTQIEVCFDAPYNHLVFDGPAKPVSLQVEAALKALPASKLKSYRLPDQPDDASQITVTQNGVDFLSYVHPQSLKILKTIKAEDRFMSVVRTLHGELLMGDKGSLVVELAASWAIVMIVTGLYLWWPRGATGLAGVVWPRLKSGPRVFWRDIHAVTGIWVSGFAIILLLSGLPWTNVWGDVFKKVREATNTAAISQDWSHGHSSEHADMGGANEEGHSHMMVSAVYQATIDDIAATARSAKLQPPVLLYPPSAIKPEWRVVSQTQNRPLGATLSFDAADGTLLNTQKFADKHPIDQVVGIGIAVHEGALFGWVNQVLGLLTAFGLITLSVSAFVMWRRRAPSGQLGAPPPIPDHKVGAGIGLLILGFGLFLPVLGISIMVVALLERLILTRIVGVRRWLGLALRGQAKAAAL